MGPEALWEQFSPVCGSPGVKQVLILVQQINSVRLRRPSLSQTDPFLSPVIRLWSGFIFCLAHIQKQIWDKDREKYRENGNEPIEIGIIKESFKYSALLLRNKGNALLNTPTDKTADCMCFPLAFSVVQIHSASKCLCERTYTQSPWEWSSFSTKYHLHLRGHVATGPFHRNEKIRSATHISNIVQGGPSSSASPPSLAFSAVLPFKSSKTQRCVAVSYCITLSLKLLWGITASWYQMMHPGLTTAFKWTALERSRASLYFFLHFSCVFLKTNLLSDFPCLPFHSLMWCKAATWGRPAVCIGLCHFFITLMENPNAEACQPWFLTLLAWLIF